MLEVMPFENELKFERVSTYKLKEQKRVNSIESIQHDSELSVCIGLVAQVQYQHHIII